MKTPSPYAHIYLALADGETEFQTLIQGNWCSADIEYVLRSISQFRVGPENIRVKPATIRIGNREVPKPRTDKQTGWAMGIGGTMFYWESMSDFAEVTNSICALMEGRE